MDPTNTYHQTAAMASYFSQLEKQIDEAAAEDGNDNTLDVTLETGINATSSRAVMSNFPFGDLENDLRNHWYIAFQAARNYDWMNSKQDTLLRLILSAQTIGTLSRQNSGIVVQTSAGKIWTDLPFLTEDALKASVQSADLPVHKRRNLASFLARLVSVGICNDAIAGCALIAFRDALESPRPLENSNADHQELSVADIVPVLLAWLSFASDRLIALSSASFNGVDEGAAGLGKLAKDAGVTGPGFSPSRWRFWKQKLETFAELDKDAAVLSPSFETQEGQDWKESARQCLLIMKESAEHCSGILTEANDVFGN